MCSVGILTTGFNFPALDCLVILRPTESLALHQQILGRGTRTADGKKNCLVIDFSGNLVVHGGICVGMEECYTQKDDKMVAVSAQPAPKKEKRKVKTAKELSELDPLLANPKGFRARVLDIGFIVINSKAQPGKRLLMATYDCVTEGGLIVNASCFLCVEYSGFALQQAGNWFKRRGEDSFPRNAEAARSFCWGLPVPREVLIKKNGKYLNIEQEFM
jgi:DNA repair protein RadD